MILIYKFTNNSGFGDNLRGFISILQIQKKINFELIVDLKNHRFEKYFLYTTPNTNTRLKRNIKIYYDDEENHHLNIYNRLISTFKKTKIVEIKTNAYPILNEIDENIKDTVKTLLLIRPEIIEYLNAKYYNLPKNYNLFHYRLGDNYFYNDDVNNDNDFVNNFILNKKDNSVLISDSLNFKRIIKQKFQNEDVFIFMNKPHHTQMNNCNFLDTFSDFYLVKNASSVSCYSCYRWISNFVHWTAVVYNVPINRI